MARRAPTDSAGRAFRQTFFVGANCVRPPIPPAQSAARISPRDQGQRPAKRRNGRNRRNLRHCWLNPESRIVFSGAKRRKQPPLPPRGGGAGERGNPGKSDKRTRFPLRNRPAKRMQERIIIRPCHFAGTPGEAKKCPRRLDKARRAAVRRS
jgi:hypothetical protein